ncbi:MAG: GNAT family N-acetyltransferase [Coxiellaceae bacterium]|nr:GNAT family N-acetyltransferase [Coxiellaceae bacterium]
MMNSNYTISNMSAAEVHTAIDWANNEGWNPGLHDAETFYQADPNGFFCGKIDDKIVAVGAAVKYSADFAFFGLYIVDESYRGQGYGMALTQARLEYTEGCNRGLDGVLENVGTYAKIGFTFSYTNQRYQLEQAIDDIRPDSRVVDLAQVPFEQVLAYDRHCFAAPREAFLRAWCTQPDSHAVAWQENGELKGYAVMRRCVSGYKIGPLFADNFDVADALFQTLCSQVDQGPVVLDVPDTNAAALQLVKKHYMNLVFETARMYTGEQPELDLARVYGVTTFEIG